MNYSCIACENLYAAAAKSMEKNVIEMEGDYIKKYF